VRGPVPQLPSDAHPHRHTVLNLLLAAIGAALLVVTVQRVGWTDVRAGLGYVGWWFVVVVVLGGVRFGARALAWMACVRALETQTARTQNAERTQNFERTPNLVPTPNSELHTLDFLSAVLAGDALGNLTPLGVLASEPAKVLMMRARLSTAGAIASVALENAFYIASVVAMLAAGAVVFLNRTNVPDGLRVTVQAILAGTVLAALVGVVSARYQPALLSHLARGLASWTGRGRQSLGQLARIEAQFYGMIRWPVRSIASVLGWEALFHAVAVAEVFLVLRLLPGGSGTALSDAFVLETTGRLIAVAFKFVPYRLGVDEAGTALVARALSLDPTGGVTLALIRRIRILCWNAIGLVLLARAARAR
jgi:hypothetical protein